MLSFFFQKDMCLVLMVPPEKAMQMREAKTAQSRHSLPAIKKTQEHVFQDQPCQPALHMSIDLP